MFILFRTLNHSLFHFLFLLLAALLSVNALTNIVAAQMSNWGEPVKIFSTEKKVGSPLLVTDGAGRVHIFWTELQSDTDDLFENALIYYMMKDDGDWSDPINILVVDGKHGGSVQGDVDEFGLPLIVFGGINEPLQFSRAISQVPTKPQEWTQPSPLTTQQLGGNLAADNKGNIHIIYGEVDGLIRYIQMDDHLHVIKEQDVGPLPDDEVLMHPASLFLSSDGVIHTVIPAITPPFEGINSYYTQSRDNGDTWTPLERITLDNSNTWAITEDIQGLLHVLFIGSRGVGGRFHRYSEDSGASWSEPITITLPADGSGFSGGDFAVDSAGTLHSIIGLQNDSVIAHSQWSGVEWSPWQDITGESPRPSEFMRIGITHGNRLHVVWESDGNSIWYVEGRSTSPETTPNNLAGTAEFEINPDGEILIAQPSTTEVPDAGVTPIQSPTSFDEETSQIVATVPPLLFGILAALLVVFTGVAWQLRKRS